MADAKTPLKSPSKSPSGSKAASPEAASPSHQDLALGPGGLLPADHWAQQEPVPGDNESAIGAFTSSTASVTSSILNYRTLHGRRYHGEIGNASYWYCYLISSTLRSRDKH